MRVSKPKLKTNSLRQESKLIYFAFLNISSMQARFGNIKAVISLDLKNDIEAIKKLYETIQFHIQRLPHIGEKQPLSWINVRQELEELSLNESFI